MAYKCISEEWCSIAGDTKREYVCDTVEDVANLPVCCAGSTAIVASGGAVYMVNASGEWVSFTESEEA